MPAEEAGQECKARIKSINPRRPEVSSPVAVAAGAAAERPILLLRYFRH